MKTRIWALQPGGAPDISLGWLQIGSINLQGSQCDCHIEMAQNYAPTAIPCLALQLVQMALQGLSMLLGIAYHDLTLDSTCPMVRQTQRTATRQNHWECQHVAYMLPILLKSPQWAQSWLKLSRFSQTLGPHCCGSTGICGIPGQSSQTTVCAGHGPGG